MFNKYRATQEQRNKWTNRALIYDRRRSESKLDKIKYIGKIKVDL